MTGAATGNGAAIRHRLIVDGASLVAFGEDKDGLDTLLDELDRDRSRTVAVEGDVRDEAALRGAVALAEESFGALHLAVNK